MYTDLMVDIETLGIKPGSVIIQIGLAKFNVKDRSVPILGHSIPVSAQGCLDIGMTVDWASIEWWFSQSEEAQKNAILCAKFGLNPLQAMGELDAYVRQAFGFNCLNRVWANGASFDPVLLDDMARRVGVKCPWPFWNLLDTRTAAFLNPEAIRPAPTVPHNGEDDAIAQAQWMINVYQGLVPGEER